MLTLPIFLDAAGAFPELNPALGNKVHNVRAENGQVKLGRLPHATLQGNSTVGVFVQLGEKEFLLAEITMKFFLQAADLFRAVEAQGNQKPEGEVLQ